MIYHPRVNIIIFIIIESITKHCLYSGKHKMAAVRLYEINYDLTSKAHGEKIRSNKQKSHQIQHSVTHVIVQTRERSFKASTLRLLQVPTKSEIESEMGMRRSEAAEEMGQDMMALDP